MDKNNLQKCFEYGILKHSRKNLRKQSFSVAFWGFCVATPGLFFTSTTKIYYLLVCILAVVYCFVTFFMTKKLDLKKRISIAALDSVIQPIIFILDSAICWEIAQAPNYWFHIATLPFAFAGISLLIMWYNVKRNRFLKIKYDFNVTWLLVTLLGGVVLVIVLAIFINTLNWDEILIFTAVFMEVMACIFSLDASAFLKLHYMRVLKRS